MKGYAVLASLVLLLVTTSSVAQEELPYPRGQSKQSFGGTEYRLYLPEDYDPGKRYPMYFATGGITPDGYINAMKPLVEDGFIACIAPSGLGSGNEAEEKRILDLYAHLTSVLSVDRKQVHLLSFSVDAGSTSNLASVKGLSPITLAVWAPRSSGDPVGSLISLLARKGHGLKGVLFLAGEESWRERVDSLNDALGDGLLRMETFVHPELKKGHLIETNAVQFAWLKSRGGRFTPGGDCSFAWLTDPEAARSLQKRESKAGFLYFYSRKDADSKVARKLESEIFRNSIVRFYGRQLVALKLCKEDHEEYFASLGLKKTPALMTLTPDFKPRTTLEGRTIIAKRVRAAFRAAAEQTTLPR